MVRKYQFADIASLVVLLLDLVSLFILNGPILYLIIGSVVVMALAILIRRYYPINIDSMIKRFDFNVVWMVLCYLYSVLNNITDTRWIIPSVFACVLALMIIIFMRSNTDAKKGKVAAIVIFAIMIILAIAISGSVGAVAGSAVVSIFEIIGAGFKWIGNMIDRFIQYLISLLPDVTANGGTAITGTAIEYEIPEIEEDAASPVIGYIAAVIVAITVIYVLVLLIKRFTRHGRAVKKEKERLLVTKKKRTKIGLALEKLRKELAYQIKMRMYMTKNTPLARYYKLVYSKRLTPQHKEKHETPREFIKRSTDSENWEPDFVESVERELYGSK